MRHEAKDRKSHRTYPSRSEFDFVERLRKRALSHSSHITHHASLSLGIGDDAAVIQQYAGRDTVITSDLLVEDVDFRLKTTTPRLLGDKALAVSLSDIAAMGALPRYALLSIGLPREVWESDFADKLYEGFFALAAAYRVALIGGDVSRTPERIIVDSIVIGEASRGRAIRRSGARPGHHIFVTGSLGGAAAGLRLLERGTLLSRRRPRSAHDRDVERLLLRQLRPEPRVAWGATLGVEGQASSMIDISDGLSSDLAHLCDESDVGAIIDASRVPVDAAVMDFCGRRALNPLELALHGGEDFELLFTVRPRDLSRLPRNVGRVPATYIGDVTADSGRIQIMEGSRVRTLEPCGYRHF
jgi:thiamine-monophosphate kinase